MGIISSWLRAGKTDVKHEGSAALTSYRRIGTVVILSSVDPRAAVCYQLYDLKIISQVGLTFLFLSLFVRSGYS